MMAIPRGLEATVLPDVSVSWSNRNGGELLLIGGSVRMVVSAAWAQSIVDKLSNALDVPKRAAEMASGAPAPEPERIALPSPVIVEPYRYRLGALMSAVPHQGTRLMALREAQGIAACEGAEFVMIARIAFTFDEVKRMVSDLESRDPVRRGAG